MPSHFLHRILSAEMLIWGHLLHARCFPHHYVEVKHLFVRNKHVRMVIALRPCSIQELSPVVVPLEFGLLRMKRRKPKSLYLFFIERLILNFLRILPNLDKLVRVQSVVRAAVIIKISISCCSFRIEYIVYSLHELLHSRESTPCT